MERKPFILSVDVPAIAFHLGRKLAEPDLPYYFHLDVTALTDGRDSTETVDDLEGYLADVRAHLGLAADADLVAVMVGSHGSLVPGRDASQSFGGLNFGLKVAPPLNKWSRVDRALAGMLDRALGKLGGLRLTWLADAFPELRPADTDHAYAALAAQAREELARLKPLHQDQGLRRLAVPMIFVNEGDDGAWQPLSENGTGARSRSTTAALIKQFRKQRSTRPRLRGVLAKLLLDDLEQHCVTDAPVVGENTLRMCREAAIEAILLDGRKGILRPIDLDVAFEAGGTPMPVFAA